MQNFFVHVYSTLRCAFAFGKEGTSKKKTQFVITDTQTYIISVFHVFNNEKS